MDEFMTSELEVLETRPVWRRRITVFGRSIPISVIALLLFTVVALAAFFSTIVGRVEIAAGGEQVVTLTAQNLVSGGTNSGQCALASSVPSGEFKLKVVGIFPNENCLFSLDVLADSSNIKSVFIGKVENTDGSLAGIVSIGDQPACGNTLAPGASANVPFTITADSSLESGTLISAALLGIDFPLSVPSC